MRGSFGQIGQIGQIGQKDPYSKASVFIERLSYAACYH